MGEVEQSITSNSWRSRVGVLNYLRGVSPLVLFGLELTGLPRHSIKHPEPENLKHHIW
jgi:hypothetical protein